MRGFRLFAMMMGLATALAGTAAFAQARTGTMETLLKAKEPYKMQTATVTPDEEKYRLTMSRLQEQNTANAAEVAKVGEQLRAKEAARLEVLFQAQRDQMLAGELHPEGIAQDGKPVPPGAGPAGKPAVSKNAIRVFTQKKQEGMEKPRRLFNVTEPQ